MGGWFLAFASQVGRAHRGEDHSHVSEKWTGGAAVLIALLGLSGAIIGKDTLDGLPTAAKAVAVICIAAAAVLAGVTVLLSYRAPFRTGPRTGGRPPWTSATT